MKQLLNLTFWRWLVRGWVNQGARDALVCFALLSFWGFMIAAQPILMDLWLQERQTTRDDQ